MKFAFRAVKPSPMNSVNVGIVHILGVIGWLGSVVLLSVRFLEGGGYPSFKKNPDQSTKKKFSACLRMVGLLMSSSGLFCHYQQATLQADYQERFWSIHSLILVWGTLVVVLFLLDPYLYRNPEKE